MMSLGVKPPSKLTQAVIALACATFSPSLSTAEEIEGIDFEREIAQLKKKEKPSPERTLKEARILFFWGMAESDPERKAAIFVQGRDLVEPLVSSVGASRGRSPASTSPAHNQKFAHSARILWAAHQGEFADLNRGPSEMRTAPRIEGILRAIAEENPHFAHAAAERGLAKLYWRAPRWISVGDPSKAREHMAKAIELAPQYPGNWVYYAELLLDQGDEKAAREAAQRVLSSPELKKYPLERPSWVRSARHVLARTADLR